MVAVVVKPVAAITPANDGAVRAEDVVVLQSGATIDGQSFAEGSAVANACRGNLAVSFIHKRKPSQSCDRYTLKDSNTILIYLSAIVLNVYSIFVDIIIELITL